MVAEHKTFTLRINPAPHRKEPAVLFTGKARTEAGHKVGPAIHDYFLAHTVLEGEGTFELAGKRYACRGGDTFFIFPGMLFRYEAGSLNPWHYCWVGRLLRSAAFPPIKG